MNRRARWVVVVALGSPLLYIAWWHVSFVLVFWLIGGTIEATTYARYVKDFLFGPGLEIPSYIQLAAILFTVLTIICFWVISWSTSSHDAQQQDQPPGRG